MWKGLADNKKVKRLSKEEIKTKLWDAMTIDEVAEFEDLNKEAEEIQDPEKAAEITKQFEDIIKTKNKGVINVAYHQGQVFKRFKENERFAKLVGELGLHKTTIIFRINVFKLCKKYPNLLKSSIGLGFFKNYHKDNVEHFYLLKLSMWGKSLLQTCKQKYALVFIFNVYEFLNCASVIGCIKN